MLKKTDFHFEGDVNYKGEPHLLFRRGITQKLCESSWTEEEIIAEEVFNQTQIQRVEELAYEIWNEYFTPIIGKAQVDYSSRRQPIIGIFPCRIMLLIFLGFDAQAMPRK